MPVDRSDEEEATADPDLLIDFAEVTLRRGGRTLVGPVTWSVELDDGEALRIGRTYLPKVKAMAGR